MTDLPRLRDGGGSPLGQQLLNLAARERAPERTRYHVHAALGVGLAGGASLGSVAGSSVAGGSVAGSSVAGSSVAGGSLGTTGAISVSKGATSISPLGGASVAPAALGGVAVGLAGQGAHLVAQGLPLAAGAAKASVFGSTVLGWGAGAAVWLKVGLVGAAALGSAYIGYSAAGPLRGFLTDADADVEAWHAGQTAADQGLDNTSLGALAESGVQGSRGQLRDGVLLAPALREVGALPEGSLSTQGAHRVGGTSASGLDDARVGVAEADAPGTPEVAEARLNAGFVGGVDGAQGRCSAPGCAGAAVGAGADGTAVRTPAVDGSFADDPSVDDVMAEAVLRVSDLAPALDEGPGSSEVSAAQEIAASTKRAVAARRAAREAAEQRAREAAEAQALEAARSQHLAMELRILGQVRSRLAVGDKTGARRLLREYASRFPDGELRPEAGLLATKAR